MNRALLRTIGIAALAVTLFYLGWRITSTLDGAAMWLAVPLVVLEVHALLSLGLYTFGLWDVDAAPTPPQIDPATFRIAVLIPSYNEPREILLPTIAAAVALQPAHETWVLDDGDRPWVAELATRLGARYRTREQHDHAKAGNINAVLPELDVDLVAVFDADHIADADFLAHTVPYFADPKIALVQTPQDFYNVESFEHMATRRGKRFGEQELFYHGIAAGRNRWGAAFWCGTNAVLRLAALRDVGGVATTTITEDIHTTIRMHRRGWHTVYHNEVLARGLAAATIQQYLTQRLRWGTGAMQVLRAENPAVVRGLTLGQRISYLTTLLGWFDSWRTLGYLVLPVATVLTGALPMSTPLGTFLPWFLAVFLIQRLALRALARGHVTLWHATLFEFVRLPANLRATLTLFGKQSRRFTVTGKGKEGEFRTRMPAPRLLVGLLAGHVLGVGWYAATALGLMPISYDVPWVAHGAAIWLCVNAAILVAAIHRIRSPQYGTERRAAVRFDIAGDAMLDRLPARLRDLSLTGAQVMSGAPHVVGEQTVVSFAVNGSRFTFPAIVRSVSPTSGQIGLEFGSVPEAAVSELALALFATHTAPHLTERAQPSRTATVLEPILG